MNSALYPGNRKTFKHHRLKANIEMRDSSLVMLFTESPGKVPSTPFRFVPGDGKRNRSIGDIGMNLPGGSTTSYQLFGCSRNATPRI